MAERSQIDPLMFDHWLYHALIGRLEGELGLEPCSAIKLAGKLTDGLTKDALAAAPEKTAKEISRRMGAILFCCGFFAASLVIGWLNS